MELINLIIKKYAWVIGLLTLIGVEIAPIKFSPIKMLGAVLSRWLGISQLDSKINDLKKEVDANEIDRIKYEILQFSSSLRNGLNRTETAYQHIETIFTKYKNKGGNSYIMHEMEYIRECHDKRRIL